MYLETSDKGWLRAILPNVRPDQLERFIERVGMKLDHGRQSGDDVDRARQDAFSDVFGTAK